MLMGRSKDDQANLIIYNYSDVEVSLTPAIPAGAWQKIFDSAALKWDGPGARLPEILPGGEESALSMSACAFALFHAGPIEDNEKEVNTP